jgi:proteasome lid subunit RPN8/RPN11
MEISTAMLDELVDHARSEAPNECCGMIAAADGRATRVYRATNEFASPLRYKIEPREQLQIFNEIDGAGWEIGAIYHSHTRSRAYPSQTDITLAANWPDPLYVIVGVADSEPEVCAFKIIDGKVEQVALEVGE